MKTRALHQFLRYGWLALALAAWPIVGNAQVAVAEIEEIEELPTLSATELEELIGPIALYPDDLLAVVLPASTFPLQIVEAARFLEALEDDPSLEPDADWDDAVVALTNYPEVVELLNEDLDWTWRLGEAVVAQQAEVISAIELFRDRAYAAGNLKSDDYQLVAHDGGAIQITPVEEDVIYVPYYEPERVVVYSPRPVYYYYPRAYPVYYYPYPTYHAFRHDYFWGVTTAFSIGWHSHHLNVFHHSYWGHPYYGRSYWNRWWYRRPDIHVHNNVYVRNRSNVAYDRYRHGDRWQPNVRRTVRSSDQRVTRTRYYRNDDVRSSRHRNSSANSNSLRSVTRDNAARIGATRNSAARNSAVRNGEARRDRNRDARQNTRRPDVRFRDRSGTPTALRDDPTPDRRTKFNRAKRDRESDASGISQRRSATRPTSPARETTVRPTQKRHQAQPRQSRREVTPQRQVRKQSAPQRQSRPKASYQRPPQPRSTQSRQQSAPKQSSAKPSRSRSTERVARNSQSRSSKSSRRMRNEP